MGRIWETPKEEKETFFKKLFCYIDTLESQTPDILFNHKTTSWAKQNSQSKRKIFHT